LPRKLIDGFEPNHNVPESRLDNRPLKPKKPKKPKKLKAKHPTPEPKSIPKQDKLKNKSQNGLNLQARKRPSE